MSGIFAFTGTVPCRDRILTGLCRLKEKGGEISGIAERGENALTAYHLYASPEKLKESGDKIKCNGYTGIAGCKNIRRIISSEAGCVPFSDGFIATVCDGYVRNFSELKKSLPESTFIRDDEALLHALLVSSDEVNRIRRLKGVWERLDGSVSAVTAYSDEDALYCVAGKAPLYICYYDDGFAVTNGLAATGGAVRYAIIENGEAARITPERVTLYDSRLKRMKKQLLHPAKLLAENEYMLTNSVYSMPIAVKDTLDGLTDGSVITMGGYRVTRRLAEKTDRIMITAAGSALTAARLGACALERLTDIPCAAYPASELLLSPALFERDTLVIGISHSPDFDGVCACMERAREFGAKTLAFTPERASCLARCSDGAVVIESSLLSDKNGFGIFPAQALALCLLALKIGYINEIINSVYCNVALKIAEMLPGKISASLKSTPQLTAFSRELITGGRVIFTGLCADGALAEEAALKFRSMTGINALYLNLGELENEPRDYAKTSKTVAFITGRELAPTALKTLIPLYRSGADVTVITSESIAQEFECPPEVITFPDSIELFNWTGALSCIYAAASAAQAMQNEESGQKAV